MRYLFMDVILTIYMCNALISYFYYYVLGDCSYRSLKVINLHFSIFKALNVLDLTTRSFKVLNFIFVKSSPSIKIMVVFIIR